MLVVVAVLAVSCRSTESTTAIPTVEADQPGLLPPPEPTPTAQVAAAPATPAPSVDPQVEATPADVGTPETPSLVSCLSPRARAGQLLLSLVKQPDLVEAQSYAAAGELGGIGFLGSPDEGVADAIAELQQTSFVPLMVASDEEGGSVQRFASLLGPLPSAAESARLSVDEVRNQWVEYGFRVKALGVDVIFGPVVDVGAGPGIESRSFGDDPALVTTYGQAVVDGLLEAGVTPVLKHFPGHGHATEDSHFFLPTTPSLDELRTSDLVPYAELLADPRYGQEVGVMIGHLSVPGLSDEVPTSLSPETIDGLLRGELGFDGLVFTDALNMGAIDQAYGRLEALELAILAGSDIAIVGSLADITPSLDYLVQRSGDDPALAAVIDNRAARILIAKGQGDLCAGAT